eukprot:gene6318-12783_t
MNGSPQISARHESEAEDDDDETLLPQKECSICLGSISIDSNPLIFCEGRDCSIWVHQDCYNIDIIPEGPWKCDICSNGADASKVKCKLCDDSLGTFKATTIPGEWVHSFCAMCLHEVKLVHPKNIYDLKTIEESRFKLSCSICKQNNEGVCITCSFPNCIVAVHPHCAIQCDSGFTHYIIKQSRNKYAHAHIWEVFCEAHVKPKKDCIEKKRKRRISTTTVHLCHKSNNNPSPKIPSNKNAKHTNIKQTPTKLINLQSNNNNTSNSAIGDPIDNISNYNSDTTTTTTIPLKRSRLSDGDKSTATTAGVGSVSISTEQSPSHPIPSPQKSCLSTATTNSAKQNSSATTTITTTNTDVQNHNNQIRKDMRVTELTGSSSHRNNSSLTPRTPTSTTAATTTTIANTRGHGKTTNTTTTRTSARISCREDIKANNTPQHNSTTMQKDMNSTKSLNSIGISDNYIKLFGDDNNDDDELGSVHSTPTSTDVQDELELQLQQKLANIRLIKLLNTKINTFDFKVVTVLIKNDDNYPEMKCNNNALSLIKELKRFLILTFLEENIDNSLLFPSLIVDMAWRHLLTLPKLNNSICTALLSCIAYPENIIIDRVPSVELKKTLQLLRYEYTLKRYNELFDADPPVKFWPKTCSDNYAKVIREPNK